MIDHRTLYQTLQTLGIPVAYDHFDSNKQVSIPFLVYREQQLSTFRADDITYHQFHNFELELVTEKKEIALEQQLEDLLTTNKIPYEKNDEVWDNDEKIYHNYYEI